MTSQGTIHYWVYCGLYDLANLKIDENWSPYWTYVNREWSDMTDFHLIVFLDKDKSFPASIMLICVTCTWANHKNTQELWFVIQQFRAAGDPWLDYVMKPYGRSNFRVHCVKKIANSTSWREIAAIFDLCWLRLAIKIQVLSPSYLVPKSNICLLIVLIHAN